MLIHSKTPIRVLYDPTPGKGNKQWKWYIMMREQSKNYGQATT